MSARRLRCIAGWIRSGELGPVARTDNDIDALLSLRDEWVFDSAWVATNDAVQQLLRDCDPETQELALVEEVAREAFLATATISALAPYVSDDLRLVAEALLVGYESPWLTGLLQSYVDGEFPAGAIETSSLELRELVDSL